MTGCGADVAVVGGDASDGELVGEGCRLFVGGCFDLFGVGGKVFARFKCLDEGSLGIDVVEGLEGNEIGEAELLVEREPDGAGEGEFVLLEVVLSGDEALLLVLIIDLSAEDVEPRTGSRVVLRNGLIERDLRGGELGIDGFDAGGICDAKEVGVAYGEDDEIAGVFGGILRAFEVVPGGEVVLQCGDVYQILREIGAEVDDLKGTDDGVEAGNVESECSKVDLLDLDAAGCVDGGQKGLQLFETLSVGVFHGGVLQDQTEVLAQAALDCVVEGEIENAAGGFAGDDAAVEGVLGWLCAVLAGGVVEALLSVGDGGAVGGCAGAAWLFLLRRPGGGLRVCWRLTGYREQAEPQTEKNGKGVVGSRPFGHADYLNLHPELVPATSLLKAWREVGGASALLQMFLLKM